MAPPTVPSDATARAATTTTSDAANRDPFAAERLPKRGLVSASNKPDAGIAPGAVATPPPDFRLQANDVSIALRSIHDKYKDLNYERFRASFPAGQSYEKGHEATERRDNQFRALIKDARDGDKNSQLFLLEAATAGGAGLAGDPIKVGNKDLKTGYWGFREDGNEGVYTSSAKGYGIRAAEVFSQIAADPNTSEQSRRQMKTIIPYAIMAGTIDGEQRKALLPGLESLAAPGTGGNPLVSPQTESAILISAVVADLRRNEGGDEFQRQAMARLVKIQPVEMHDQIENLFKLVAANGQPGASQAAKECLTALRDPKVNASEALASLLDEKMPAIPGFAIPADTASIKSATAKPGVAAGAGDGGGGGGGGGGGSSGTDDFTPGPVAPKSVVEQNRLVPPPPEPLPADLVPPTEAALANNSAQRTTPLETKTGPTENVNLPENVKLDEAKRIKQIIYKGGASCEFGRDSAGELNAVTIKEQGAADHKFIRENDKWFSTTSGQKLPLNGALEVRANGDLVGPIGDGSKRLVWQPSGETHLEQKLATGATIAGNAEGYTKTVLRSDGSSIADLSNGTTAAFVENAGGKTTKWTLKEGTPGKGDDVWVSDADAAVQRRNMQLEKNGNLTFTGAEGERHIVRSNGVELVEGKGRSSFTFDDQGRIKSVAYPDGNNIFSFDYKNNTEKIDVVNTHYNKTGVDKANKPDRTWGEPMLSAEGVYSQMSYQVLGGQVYKGLQTFNTNGDFVYNTLHSDGTVHITDAYNKKTYALRNAIVGDFVQPADSGAAAGVNPGQLQQLRDQQLRQQIADRDDRAKQAAAEQMQLQLAQQRQQSQQQDYYQEGSPQYTPQRPQQTYTADSQCVQSCRQSCSTGGSSCGGGGCGGCGGGGGGCGGGCGGGSCGGGGGGGGGFRQMARQGIIARIFRRF